MTELITQLKNTLDSADAVIIGSGAGLSTSAGFTYSGERFEKYFSDFAARYGFSVQCHAELDSASIKSSGNFPGLSFTDRFISLWLNSIFTE